MTYRTNHLSEKALTSFNSTTSLGALQSSQMQGPGQKFISQT